VGLGDRRLGGIGGAFARALAQAGVNVVLTDRREDRLRALATELETQHHVQTRALVVDLGVEGACRRWRHGAISGHAVDLYSTACGKRRASATNTVWFSQLYRRSPLPNYLFEFHVCRT
jgi:NAD(P)-dependent dehydrogenase (short-subunit alcohol dehydrogenase family)